MTALAPARFVGSIETGKVYEQQVEVLMAPRPGEDADDVRIYRLVRVELTRATRGGDKTLLLLTDLSKSAATGKQVAELYRRRWTIETMFQQLEAHLHSEVNTLGYPAAALFAFCVALVAGLSISAEYRQRTYHNTWSENNRDRTFADFGALPNGSPDPAMAGTGRYFQVARPYPMVGSVTLFNIDPAVRTDTDNLWDATMEPGYTNVYRGFELSVQARMPNGGTVFGGWSLEDTGRNTIYNYDKGAGSRYGGEVNNCSDILARGDNPNELRFCDAGSYPRQLRNEFKLNGNYPFSLPGLGQMQVGASLQAYPGGAGDWGGLQEGLYVHRTQGGETGTYSQTLYGQPGHCVTPCELGGRLVPAEASTVSTSTSNYWIPMIPLNSVKFVPYWTQLDVNVQKVFNVGNWRYDARFEFFNLLNNNVEIWHTGSRNARGSTGAGYQTLSQWERADKILEGRVIRFAITARF